MNEGGDLRHVPAHYHQNTGQSGQRHHGGILPGQHQDKQQGNGVNDTGNGGLATGADVRGRAGDGSGGRNATEKGRGHIAHALADKLGVRVVARTGHTIGHACTEQ